MANLSGQNSDAPRSPINQYCVWAMNDDRQQVYLNFVNTLLVCPEDEIESRLQANLSVVNVGLLQTLTEVTEFLTWGGDRKAAQRLRWVSERILGLVQEHRSENDLAVSPEEAQRLVTQGTHQYQASQFREALQSWQQALSIYQIIGDSAGEARVLNNMGIALKSLGQYQQAIENYQQSVAIRREGGDRPWLEIRAKHSDTQGWVEHHVRGEFHQGMQLAIEHFRKQQKLANSIGDRLVEAKAWHNLGKAHNSLEQPAKALEYHQKALAIQRSIGDRTGEFASLELLAQTCETLQTFSEAIAYYQQYLDLAQQQNHNQALSNAWSGLGHGTFALANYPQALQYYQQG
ncbi:MAG: tetratricopeptide repeat protein, partial [Jaaginema sp. PMC 1079.18]|nr:tetratricopeptide repeat protein [Jaaginema sp. PMC 1079.18]